MQTNTFKKMQTNTFKQMQTNTVKELPTDKLTNLKFLKNYQDSSRSCSVTSSLTLGAC